MKASKLLLPTLLLSVMGTGCGKGSSFSNLADQDTFKQTSGTVTSKLDILWVIDNSGSMQTSQQDVNDNLAAFIQEFSNKNLDFKMAVTSTDAYRVNFNNNHNCSKFRDGIRNSSCNTVNGKTYSGIPVIESILPAMLDLNFLRSTFLINSLLTDTANNIYGSGDERAFSSMQAAFDEPLNAGFLRPDSFLSVIIVSDEEDFSHTGSNLNESYANTNLIPVSNYVNYLDTLTGSTPTNRRYNVNTISILDDACRVSLNTTFSGRKIGLRYIELVDSVNTAFTIDEIKGKKKSLCGDFATDLVSIANGAVTNASRFPLQRLPIESSIAVIVNGNVVPNNATNPLANGGWAYEASSNSILFIGSLYIPASGASIKVTYDPQGYGQ
jgi:hypothetical protein